MKITCRTKLLVVALVLCMTTMIGSTFAWFTDSVESNDNKIVAGKLKVDLEVWNGTKWVSLKDEPSTKVFDSALWEPGHTQLEAMKIVNEGNLALEYELHVTMTGETKNSAGQTLADAIDVYMCFDDVSDKTKSFADITTANGWWKAGTLADLIASEKGFTQGTMLPAVEGQADGVVNQGVMQGSCTCTIALHMQEEAGNEYQGLSLGTVGFMLNAKQAVFEKDSFDNQYDANAAYPGAADVWDGTVNTAWYNDTDTTFALSTAEEFAGFAKLVNEGNKFSQKTIELESNLDFGGKEWTPIKNFAGTLNGNEHTISNFEIDATAGNAGFFDVLEWATVEDLVLTDITATVGNYRFGVLARSINQTNIDNVTVKNVIVTTTGSEAFVAGLFAQGTVNSNMEVNNCTVENFTVHAENGAMIIGGITDFVQKNGTEAEGTNVFENLNVKNFKVIANDTDGYCNIGGLVGQTQSVWQNPRFNNCSVSGLDVTATGTVNVGGFMCAPGSYTYAENCTVEGKIDVSGVTAAENHAGGFFGDYGWGDNVSKGDHWLKNCSADVDITTKIAAAGGFVGSGTNSEGRNKNITLISCEAKGTVTCVEGGTANIGGFAGQTDRGIYTNCSAAQEPFIGKVLDGYQLVDDGNGTLTVTQN